MFNRLPESKPQKQRRTGGAIVSTAVHLVFIALAVRATGVKAEVAPKVDKLKPPIYVVPERKPAPPAPSTTQPTTAGGPTTRVPPTPILPVIDDVIVPGIPAPGLAIDPEAWRMRGEFSSISTNSGPSSGPGTPNVGERSLWTQDVVDKAIFAIPGTSSPRYPSMLQSAGVEGDVRAQFVVDTLGRVERESIKILDEAHTQFAASVRDALFRARFTPAEAGGRKVRQLAEQVFTFRITR